MSTMFRVYVRDGEGPFEKWGGEYVVEFNSETGVSVRIWDLEQDIDDESPAALLRDLDLSNIPEEVHCVVCQVISAAEGNVCEGDLAIDKWGELCMLKWAEADGGFYWGDTPGADGSDVPRDLGGFDNAQDGRWTPIAHILTHKKNKQAQFVGEEVTER